MSKVEKKRCDCCGIMLAIAENFEKGISNAYRPTCKKCRRIRRKIIKKAKIDICHVPTGINPFDWRNYKQPFTAEQTSNPYNPYEPLVIERE